MKTCVICPIGFVDRWGYQRHLYEYIGSFAAGADLILLSESYRDAPLATELAARFPGVFLVSDERTWFKLDENRREIFDFENLNTCANIGLDIAREADCDVAIQISSNWYVLPDVWNEITERCGRMLDAGRPFDWLAGRYQLGGVLFHTDIRYPWIINLHNDWRYALVGSAVSAEGERASLERGDLREYDAEAIVDVPLEITVEEMAGKMNVFRCYHDLMPKRKPVFDWDFWRGYYVAKFGKMIRSEEIPSGVGVIVAAANRPEFASSIVLGEMGL